MDSTAKILPFIASQKWMKVLFPLLSKPRALRELAELSGLSLGGAHDALRRLEAASIVRSFRSANKRLFELTVDEFDRKFLADLIEAERTLELQRRAQRTSAECRSRLGWIDETLTLLPSIADENDAA